MIPRSASEPYIVRRLTKRSCLGDYLELGLLVEGERERLTE
jgi:hypothetical protein